ncbi:hypothetical protein [Natrarchaeobius oligotrophus]|uniref:Uncharacterized protein n=1 Tax=Natrarchaeobius chitinivorans TaxID=1679083 RepID=A0A3N6MNM9_NATCH|nr:hypothetical protein [Natrarchaeobius chitinivorans]RQG96096.1 hypothetical protein EA472_21000 [Natrarchaeobius chitinivorans]
MTHSRLTRRGALALAAVGLAGCASSQERDDDAPGDGTDANEDATGDADDRDTPDRDIEPDWDEAAAFRTWLLDTDGNRRFDYTATFPEDADPADGFPDFFGLETDDLEGHLMQSGTHVFFGSFDPDSIVDGVDAAEEYDLSGEYEGFYVVTRSPSDGEELEIAVGQDAIVVGVDYERRIDAHRGVGDRLEEVDPEFTHLFRELPHDTTVTGQYGSPTGANVDVDEIILWGVSSETPMAETVTWVFVFEREADLTDDALAQLEGVSSDVEDSSVDGRTATVVGAPPNIPDGSSE